MIAEDDIDHGHDNDDDNDRIDFDGDGDAASTRSLPAIISPPKSPMAPPMKLSPTLQPLSSGRGAPHDTVQETTTTLLRLQTSSPSAAPQSHVGALLWRKLGPAASSRLFAPFLQLTAETQRRPPPSPQAQHAFFRHLASAAQAVHDADATAAANSYWPSTSSTPDFVSAVRILEANALLQLNAPHAALRVARMISRRVLDADHILRDSVNRLSEAVNGRDASFDLAYNDRLALGAQSPQPVSMTSDDAYRSGSMYVGEIHQHAKTIMAIHSRDIAVAKHSGATAFQVSTARALGVRVSDLDEIFESFEHDPEGAVNLAVTLRALVTPSDQHAPTEVAVAEDGITDASKTERNAPVLRRIRNVRDAFLLINNFSKRLGAFADDPGSQAKSNAVNGANLESLIKNCHSLLGEHSRYSNNQCNGEMDLYNDPGNYRNSITEIPGCNTLHERPLIVPSRMSKFCNELSSELKLIASNADLSPAEKTRRVVTTASKIWEAMTVATAPFNTNNESIAAVLGGLCGLASRDCCIGTAIGVARTGAHTSSYIRAALEAQGSSLNGSSREERLRDLEPLMRTVMTNAKGLVSDIHRATNEVMRSYDFIVECKHKRLRKMQLQTINELRELSPSLNPANTGSITSFGGVIPEPPAPRVIGRRQSLPVIRGLNGASPVPTQGMGRSVVARRESVESLNGTSPSLSGSLDDRSPTPSSPSLNSLDPSERNQNSTLFDATYKMTRRIFSAATGMLTGIDAPQSTGTHVSDSATRSTKTVKFAAPTSHLGVNSVNADTTSSRTKIGPIGLRRMELPR